MQKRINVILLAIVVVCVAVTAFACENNTYSAMLEFDAEKGSVSFVGEVDSTKLADGSEIALEITPKTGFYLSSVTVNDEDVTSSLENENGKYTLKITVKSDLSVKVDFGKPTLEIAETEACDLIVGAPANGDAYADGETVSVSAAAKDGYKVTGIKVNGELISFANGKASFLYSLNAKVEPVFVRTMTAAAFANLQKYMRIDGRYSYDVVNHPEWNKSFIVETIFAKDMISQIETDAETGEVYYDYVYGKNKRNLTSIRHTADNTIVELISDALFDNYYNPFLLLKADDILYLSDGKYALDNVSENGKNVAQPITGYTETIAEFEISVNSDDIPVGLHIKTALIKRGDAEYVSTYDFAIGDVGTATVPAERYSPYPTTAEHAVLAAALKKANKTTAYSIRHQGHELNVDEDHADDPYYKDTDYKKYIRRDDVIYSAFPNEETGFKALHKGDGILVYPFFVQVVDDKKAITLKDPVAVSNIAEITSDFESFKPELMKFTGEKDGVKTFVLRSRDYAGIIAPCFGEGADEKSYFQYATDFTVEIKNDTLYRVKFTYATYGITEEVTLTYDFETDFSDIINELDFAHAERTSVLDPFKGQYKDDYGNFCQCDDAGFILNGIVVENLRYSSSSSANEPDFFTGKWNDKSITIMKLSSKQLLIQSEDYTLNITLTNVITEVFEIPEEYRGVWSIDNAAEDLHFKFVIQSYVMWCNDTEATLLSSGDREGLVVLVGNTTYNLVPGVDDAGNKFLMIIELRDNAEYVRFYVDYVSDAVGIEIPKKYVGLYVSDDGKQKVNISYGKITINGMTFVPTSYSETEGFVGTLGVTENYMIVLRQDGTSLQIGTMSQNYIVKLVDSVINNYVGIWESVVTDFGEGQKPYSFRFVITDTSITLTASYYIQTGKDADGNPVYSDLYSYEDRVVPFTLSDYGYAFDLEGSEYKTYIMYWINSYGNPMMIMYDNNGLLVNLQKAELQVIPKEYVGTWRYVDADNKVYEAKLAADGTAEVKLGRGYTLAVDKATYYKTRKELKFVHNDAAYFIILSENASGRFVNLYSVDADVNVNLSQVAEVHLPAKYFGTWKNSAGTVEIIAAADEFKVKLAGDSEYVNVLYVGLSPEGTGYYVFYINDVEYELEVGTYGDDQIILTYDDASSKYGVAYVPLSRQAESGAEA